MNDSETNEVTSKIGNLLLLSEHINNNININNNQLIISISTIKNI